MLFLLRYICFISRTSDVHKCRLFIDFLTMKWELCEKWQGGDIYDNKKDQSHLKLVRTGLVGELAVGVV